MVTAETVSVVVREGTICQPRRVKILQGRVASGIGDLSQWMIKYADLYEQCTGVQLYPGSLNVVLDEEYRLPADPPLRLPPAVLGGRVGMNIIPCRFMGIPAFILRTDQNEAGIGHHDRKVLEIGAAVSLRDRFDLADGEVVTIEIDP